MSQLQDSDNINLKQDTMKSKLRVCDSNLINRWKLFFFILCVFSFAGIVLQLMHNNAKQRLLEEEAERIRLLKANADSNGLDEADAESNWLNKTEAENKSTNATHIYELKYFPNGSVDFGGFNNRLGYKSYIIPDIVHLIKFNQDEITFIEMICIAAVLTNHKPNVLNIHTNVMEIKGRYWTALQGLLNFSRVRIVYLAQPSSIFGLEFGLYKNWHSSDVARLHVLQKHGGIYLDSDVYVTSSLHDYRRFEFVVEWNTGVYLGNQVLMAHQDSRILPLWLDTYKQYNASHWYYNGGVLPTHAVLSLNPGLFHRVQHKFGTHFDFHTILLEDKEWNWREYLAIHTFINQQTFAFNETSFLQFRDSPIRRMILEVLPVFLNRTLYLNEPKNTTGLSLGQTITNASYLSDEEEASSTSSVETNLADLIL